jgi:hypothetical protein
MLRGLVALCGAAAVIYTYLWEFGWTLRLVVGAELLLAFSVIVFGLASRICG